MGVVKFGSFTTHLNIDYRYIIRQLGDWSFEEGASFIVQASTAYYALTKLGGLSQIRQFLFTAPQAALVFTQTALPKNIQLIL